MWIAGQIEYDCSRIGEFQGGSCYAASYHSWQISMQTSNGR